MIKSVVFAGLMVCSLIGSAVAGAIPGTGELKGSVVAPTTFTAAKVFAHLSGKNVTYMVFSENGAYRVVNLMPGTYEVWAEKPGFTAQKQTVVIAPEKKASLDIAFTAAAVEPPYIGARIVKRKVEAFDQIYPPGPGREILERTCFICHGWNFLPAMPQPREGWGAVVDYMTTSPRFGVSGMAPFLPADRLPPADREILLDYLATNVGADAPVRVVGGEPDGPRDEAVLGKAQFIQYDLPANAQLTSRVIQEVTFDSKGNVWASNVRKEGGLTRIDPRTGAYTDFPTPNKGWMPHGLAMDADDTVWFAGLRVGLSHFDPASGKFDIYGKIGKNNGALSPFLDTKGNVYWTDLRMNELGRWDRSTNTWKMYKSPSPGASPYGIVVDHKDKVWYAEFHACAVVRFDPETEQLKAFPSPSAPCAIRRPAVDSKGNVWYGVWDKGRIERLNPVTGEVKQFQVPVPFANPYDTWIDPQDVVWASSDNYLIRLDPVSGVMSYYPTPQRTDEPKITITRDGAIWFPPRGFASGGGQPTSVAVLYPDKSMMKTFGAYFSDKDPNSNGRKYKGPPTKVTGTGTAALGPKPSGGDDSHPELGAAAD